MQQNSKQWLKAFLFVGLLMFAQIAAASDTTGIDDLDTQGKTWQNSISYAAILKTVIN